MRVFDLALCAALGACSPMVLTGGVPNLVQVDVSRNVWRSGQPTTPEAWAYLKGLGIQHVVKLNFQSEGSDSGALALGMDVTYLPIDPNGDVFTVIEKPNSSSIATAVLALKQPNTIVHCTHGQDRTGLVVGANRVVNDGWSKERAWNEMLANHFHVELPGLVAWWLEWDGLLPASPSP